MTVTPETDLEGLHSAIETAIKAQFPALATVEFYSEERGRLSLPACLIELTDMEPTGEDPGTDQLEVYGRFDAYLIIGFRTDKASLEIRKLAAALAGFIHAKRWDQTTAPAEVTAITPDDFNPQLEKYEVWRVEWQQKILIGASVWAGEGIMPTEVLASWEPETGPENVDKYEPLQEVAQA